MLFNYIDIKCTDKIIAVIIIILFTVYHYLMSFSYDIQRAKAKNYLSTISRKMV